MLAISSAIAQTRTIKGRVIGDADGEPLIGAAIVEKGSTSNGVVADVNGNFSITISSNSTLVVSYIGYKTQQVKPTSNNVVIKLLEDDSILDDIVVVGYGVQKKSDLTGAVASVKADDIKNVSTTDAAAALQGKAAGIQIINGGAPGDGAEIRVRGYSTNSSGSQNPLLIVDGLKVDNIQFLDPSLIESMEVLKDAASAAIYGAEAGNGVVLITTKTGASNGGRSKVTYSFKAINQSLGRKADIFHAADYIDYQKYIGRLSDDRLKQNGYNGQDTDWYDEVFGNSWALQHNLTFQGGNEKGHFLGSIGIVDNDGIVKGKKDTYKRLTAQINADYMLYKWLKVRTTNNIEKWDRKRLNNGYQSFLNSVVSIDPLTPAYVYDVNDMGIGMKNMWDARGTDQVYPLMIPAEYTDENPVWYGTSKYSEDATGNPLAMRDRSHATNGGLSLRGNMALDLMPVKGLTITSQLGYRIAQSNSHDYNKPFWLNGKNAKGSTYSMSAASNAHYYYQWENFATFDKSFGKHKLTVMAGMSFTKKHTDNTSVSSQDSNSKNDKDEFHDGSIFEGDGAENFLYINHLNANGKSHLEVSNAPVDEASLSYFGRLTYNYDDRYGLQINFRNDAFSSEKLSENVRHGSFPSVSGGWTISNERFFRDAVDEELVSFLKIRASWGTNGSVNPLFGYQYASTIGIGGYYQFEPGTGSITAGGAPGKQVNPNLRWEKYDQINLGLDARFFSNRLTLGLDWYKKTTRDLLLSVTGIPEIGGQQSWVNTGKVFNQGLDIELGWRDRIGDLKYNVNANFSPLQNKVKEVSSVYPRIVETGISGFNNKMQPTFEKDHSVYYFRGWKYAGVYNENMYSGTSYDKANLGKALYYDKDGKLTLAPGEDDKMDLGCAIPKFTYGITINLEYKGFDFTVFGTGQAGNKIYNLMVSADSPETNGITTYWKNSYKTDASGNVIATGKYPDMKNVATDWTFYSSDAALFNGSFFKFKQIQLGYTVPAKYTRKALISDLRFSVSLDDFFTITSYPGADPETSSLNSGASRGYDNGNYPMSKKVVFGVNLSF